MHAQVLIDAGDLPLCEIPRVECATAVRQAREKHQGTKVGRRLLLDTTQKPFNRRGCHVRFKPRQKLICSEINALFQWFVNELVQIQAVPDASMLLHKAREMKNKGLER